MTRLVDIKDVKNALMGKVNMDEETLQSIIDELPTAYDVENVIEKIKEVPHYYLYSHQDLISESDVKKMVREGIN